MIKRLFDIIFSLAGLIVFSPVIAVFAFLVFLQDYKSPFYIANRVGKKGAQFKMVKIRSMVHNADKSGVDSTSNDDMRITPIGKVIRKIKLDEISQLWNVLIGDMSLVGPRPNVERDVVLYTNEEQKLLSVRPGITDFSSIIFSDEGSILEGAENPDLLYNQIIRPYKSRLGLFYISKKGIIVDILLLVLTVFSIFSRQTALKISANFLRWLSCPEFLIGVARRDCELTPMAPPGSNEIVEKR